MSSQTQTVKTTPVAAPTTAAPTTTAPTTTAAPTSTNAKSANKNSGELTFHSYMSDVAVSTKLMTRASDIDLRDVKSVIMATQHGSKEIQSLALANMAYKDISESLFGQLQTQLRGQRGINTDYAGEIITYYKFPNGDFTTDKDLDSQNLGALKPVGSMQYTNPKVFLRDNEGGHIVLSSKNDAAYTYQYLMFRQINTAHKNKYNLQPKFSLSFQENLDSFGPGVLLKKLKFKGPNKAETVDVETSFEIFKANTADIEKLVKNTFLRYEDACNTLKETAEPHKALVCTGMTKATDSDSISKYFSCLEIFQLTKIPGFCITTEVTFDFGDFA